MSPEYQNLRGQADKIWFDFNDKVDDKSAAGGLEREIRGVVDDFEQQKNPRSIEDRVKRVIDQLEDMRSGGTVMDAGDADDLVDKFEELRQDLRRLPNY